VAKRSKKKRTPLWEQLTKDQKLDILGWTLFVLAVLTILSMVSVEQGLLTQWWISLLSTTFGWGRYLVPIFLGAAGLWLVLRHFEDRIPTLDPEQIIGIILGFFIAEITLHFIVNLVWRDVDLMAAGRAGMGGGLLGALLLDAGIKGLGMAGVIFSLIIGWIIVVAFTASVSPAEAITWLMNQREAVKNPQPMADGMSQSSRPAGKKGKRTILGESSSEQPKTKAQPEAPPQTEPPVSEPTINIASRPNDNGQVQIAQPTVGDQNWRLPNVSKMLEEGSEQYYSEDLMRRQVGIIEETLESFGAPVQVNEINQGPVVTQFGIEPGFITTRSGKTTKVKVSKIANLADDLALALSAKSVRVQAPIPGKGLVGIEVPNEDPAIVSLRDVMESQSFGTLEGRLRLGLGQDVSGQAVAADLRAMPHLLIAGATGAGKSVCMNAIIAALLLQNSPDTLRIIMVDPKRVELTQYNGIPHLLTPVIADVERVVPTLRWVTKEMDSRYRRFSNVGARNIDDYNRRIHNKEGESRIPYITVMIDELADVMMQSADEAERVICRLAQMARATGIHLIIATQRPSVDVVTGLIKANFPARIAFAVASSVDSRVILDMPGAERLLGRGDMLFMPPDAGQPLRLQGSWVSDQELNRITRYWQTAVDPESTAQVEALSKGGPKVEDLATQPSLFPTFNEPTSDTIEFEDELLPSAVEVFLSENRASISLLQRRLRIGYTRAARLVDNLSEMGVVADDMKGQSHKVNRAVAEKLLGSIDYEAQEIA
jgi:S-DNA-T family DNA segregation ATPase FtsK/SpoIIIE